MWLTNSEKATDEEVQTIKVHSSSVEHQAVDFKAFNVTQLQEALYFSDSWSTSFF